jgi:apolipoprotein N-acyltransferase
VLDLGLVFAWLGPALLFLGLQGLAPGRAARLGFTAGLVAHSAILHWIYVVTVHYGHAPAAVGLLAPVAMAAYIALFPAALSAAWVWLGRFGLATPFAAAAVWTALDHLRSFALSGFPWATLGYAQHLNPALMSLAAFTGVYGLSFVTVLGGAALARAILELAAGRRPGLAVGSAVAAVAFAHALGFAASTSHPDADSLRRVRVAVLQGNIDQGTKWTPDRAAEILANYEELSHRAAEAGARIIVWPETSVPGGIDMDAELRERLATLARETGSAFVVGGVGLEFDAGAAPTRYFDSAFLLEPPGFFTDRYDKAHLVPFGEYVPLRDWLGLVFVAMARGMATLDVTAGPGPRAVTVAWNDGAATRVRAGVPICYELLFPDLVRRFAGEGAEILFAITNDAWYGRTGAPYQFLAITALRAAESRLWTARAANTGVSAIIDARGRVRSRTGIFERGLLVADVPLRPAPLGGSFYTRYGDVFAYACWAFAAGLATVALRRQSARARAGHAV